MQQLKDQHSTEHTDSNFKRTLRTQSWILNSELERLYMV